MKQFLCQLIHVFFILIHQQVETVLGLHLKLSCKNLRHFSRAHSLRRGEPQSRDIYRYLLMTLKVEASGVVPWRDDIRRTCSRDDSARHTGQDNV